MTLAAKCFARAVLILSGYFAGVALAQSVEVSAKASKADAGSTAQSQCVSDDGGFKNVDGHAAYTMEFANNCEQRLKCKVYVYILSAQGPAHGHATFVLALKSRSAAAKKSYVLKVKMLGGMAQSTRECKIM